MYCRLFNAGGLLLKQCYWNYDECSGSKRTDNVQKRSVTFELRELVLSEIPPRTLPAFIPSDHVHPLFISLTHFPRCCDTIPMSSPSLISDDPSFPSSFFTAILPRPPVTPPTVAERGSPEKVCMHGRVHLVLISKASAASYGAIHLSSLLMQRYVFRLTDCLLPRT